MFGRQLLIDGSKIAGPGVLTDFPLLVSITLPDLRTVANGGQLRSSSAFDVLFTLGDCGTVLPYQRERYVASTGEFIAWVKVPQLNPGADMPIHMYYGRTSVPPDPSTTAVWDANYRGVWHFNNSVADASGTGNNLTSTSTANINSGKIGQGRDLNNSSNINSNNSGRHLRMPNGVLSGVTNFTFEGWVSLDRYQTNWERIFDFGTNTTRNFFFTPTTESGTPAQTRVRITTTGIPGEQGPSIDNSGSQTGSWVHWGVVYDATAQTMQVYRNGALYGSSSGVTTTPASLEPTSANYFGRSQYSADHYIDAKFDEFRISNTNRSAGWIMTSFRNQDSPSSFYSVSPPYSGMDLCLILPVELVSFDAVVRKGRSVEVSWTTGSERNNSHFTVERSRDAMDWEAIGNITGTGDSHEARHYSFMDLDPYSGLSYYRLRQTDLDGAFSLSPVRPVTLSDHSPPKAVPNPSNGYFTLIGAGQEPFVILDATGRQVGTGKGGEPYPVTSLPAGAYLIQVISPEGRKPITLVVAY